ncbi:MAG TPA: hypothetical protein VIS57_04535 [Xanthomonadales bacterium]
MGTKHGPKTPEFDSDPYDDYEDYEDELDDDLGNIKHLSKDFYSTDWEDPSESDYRFSARRKIERRKDLKNLYSDLDDGDELDFGNEW